MSLLIGSICTLERVLIVHENKPFISSYIEVMKLNLLMFYFRKMWLWDYFTGALKYLGKFQSCS